MSDKDVLKEVSPMYLKPKCNWYCLEEHISSLCNGSSIIIDRTTKEIKRIRFEKGLLD